MAFRPNPNFQRQIEAQAQFRNGLRDAAEPARAAAERFARAKGAPWLRRKGARGLIVVDVRASGVRIINTDHGGHWQEFGSRNNPPHAPLRRGVRAAGFKLTAK